MDKRKLQQLRKMRAERESLKERILNNQFNPKNEVADTVKDYRTGQGRMVGRKGWQGVRGFKGDKECCGTCRWHDPHEGNGFVDWYCVNDKSEYCTEATEYDHSCDEWEERSK